MQHTDFSRNLHVNYMWMKHHHERASLPRCAGHLFGQLVDLFAFYNAFPIDNNTAQALSEQDVQQRHYDKVASCANQNEQKFGCMYID